jgi:hypothetical protein
VVIEGAPDFVVVVERDRIVDAPLFRRVPDAFELVLEGELRRVDPDHDQPVAAVNLRPGADVRRLVALTHPLAPPRDAVLNAIDVPIDVKCC